MKKKLFRGAIVLGSLLILLAGISPAVGESNESGEGKRAVMVASETVSFGAEDCIVESCVTPSFGTEDWVGPIKTSSFGAEDCIVESLVTPSFGTENWVGPIKTSSFGAEDCIVESLVTSSFGTEDWVLASETASFGSEDWVEGMESSDVVGTGTLPVPAR